MKLEPIAYKKQKTHPVGVYYAQMSPDGWTQNFYQPEMGDKLTPDELLEFIQLVTTFLRKIKSRDDLDAYAVNNGKALTKGFLPTYGILFEVSYIICDLQITGCNCEFRPIRKEK